jgi:hypothetical protein
MTLEKANVPKSEVSLFLRLSNILKASEENRHHESRFWACIYMDKKCFQQIDISLMYYNVLSKVVPKLLFFQDHAIDEPVEGGIVVLQLVCL